MMQIPLPKGLRAWPALPKQRESVVNMFRQGNNLLPRPGIATESTGFDAARASLNLGGFAYFVMGNRIYRRLADATMVDLGELTGTGRVLHDVGIAGAVLVDSTGGSGYVLTDSSFAQITSPYFEPSRDCAYIDGFYVWCPLDGGAPFYSTAGSATNYPAANTFDAETLPDLNRGLRNWRNDLYVMGEETTELFRTTGSPNPAFARVEGGAIPVGLVAAHIEYGPSFVMIGKEKNHNYGIFQMGAGQGVRISNESVDYILNNEYTFAELETAYANRFKWDTVDIVTFHLPRHTLAFYGEWAIFESGIDEEVKEPWKAAAITFLEGSYLVGGTNGYIGSLGGDQDFGDEFAVGFDTFARSLRGSYFRAANPELDCLTGQTATEYRVSLQVSEDGQNWGQRFWRGLGTIGQTQRRVCWDFPGGLGSYESFMGIRIRSTEAVSFPIDGMQMEING